MTLKTSLVLVMLIAITLALLPSHAAESHAESYWKAKLGNTRMPTILKDSLLQESSDGRVKLNQIYKSSSMYNVVRFIYWENDAPKSPLPKDDQVIFLTDEALLSKPGGQLEGSKIKLYFGKTTDTQSFKFLPLRVSAKVTPLSSNKLEDILSLVSVKPKSTIAQKIEATIKDCEEKRVKYEVRYCATSLEGIVDYVTQSYRQNKVRVYYTDLKDDDDLKEYVILKSQKIQNNKDNNIVCHKTDNPFAVFFCHNIKKTDAYMVSLLAENGKQIKAFAVCHKDTSSWNPKHLAFQLLKIKPGSKPICHFLGANAILWVPY